MPLSIQNLSLANNNLMATIISYVCDSYWLETAAGLYHRLNKTTTVRKRQSKNVSLIILIGFDSV